jgi:HSP20 family protein
MTYLNLINELDWMQREMNRTLGNLGLTISCDSTLQRYPQMTLQQQDEQLVLTAQLPGIKAEDLEITLEKNILTLKGERKTEALEDSACRRQERVQGKFERRIELPVEVERDGITSQLENGVLTLMLPKATQARVHKIAVNG